MWNGLEKNRNWTLRENNEAFTLFRTMSLNMKNCRQYTHKHCTYSAEQSLHKRGTRRTRWAQELHNISVRL